MSSYGASVPSRISNTRLQMASTNHQLDGDIETIFMMTNPKYSYLSSSIVKEIAMFHGNVQDLVPPEVQTALIAKFSE